MKIIKTSLYEQIADQIRDMIMTGELAVGDKVKEKDLCELMEISKTPLREALKVLRAEGLIQIIPHRGSFVSKPNIEEITEMFEVMIMLEGFCARRAAVKVSEHDLVHLESMHDQLETTYSDNDKTAYIRANNVIHMFIQKLAGNKTLNKIVSDLRRKILLHRFRSLALDGRLEASIQEHREIMAAFRRRDGDAAEALIKRHLAMQLEALKTLNEMNGEARERS